MDIFLYVRYDNVSKRKDSRHKECLKTPSKLQNIKLLFNWVVQKNLPLSIKKLEKVGLIQALIFQNLLE